MDRLLGFGSDGAPVMVGKENGVAAILKPHTNPYILDSHCCGHRAALACIHTKKQSLEIRYYESINNHHIAVCLLPTLSKATCQPFSVGTVTGESKTEATPQLSGALAVHDQCT
jgi:hypothetical protein